MEVPRPMEAADLRHRRGLPTDAVHARVQHPRRGQRLDAWGVLFEEQAAGLPTTQGEASNCHLQGYDAQ